MKKIFIYRAVRCSYNDTYNVEEIDSRLDRDDVERGRVVAVGLTRYAARKLAAKKQAA